MKVLCLEHWHLIPESSAFDWPRYQLKTLGILIILYPPPSQRQKGSLNHLKRAGSHQPQGDRHLWRGCCPCGVSASVVHHVPLYVQGRTLLGAV